MEHPIKLDGDHLASLLYALMLQQGLTEFKMTTETYVEVCEGAGLECWACYDSGNTYPDYIKVVVLSKEELQNGTL